MQIFNENSIFYTAFLTIPLVFIFAFFITWIIIAHIVEIKNTCSTKEGRAKLLDEFNLLAIGVGFFIIITIVYFIIYKISVFNFFK